MSINVAVGWVRDDGVVEGCDEVLARYLFSAVVGIFHAAANTSSLSYGSNISCR